MVKCSLVAIRQLESKNGKSPMNYQRLRWIGGALVLLALAVGVVHLSAQNRRRPPNVGMYLAEIYYELRPVVYRDGTVSVSIKDAVGITIRRLLDGGFGRTEVLRSLVFYYEEDLAAWRGESQDGSDAVLLLVPEASVSYGRSGFPALVADGSVKLLSEDEASAWMRRLRKLESVEGRPR